MADDKTKTDGGDRRRVAGDQGYEVTYFARKHGLTAKGAREIIDRVGNDRKKLDAEAKKISAERSGEREARDTTQPARKGRQGAESASSKSFGKAAALGGVVAAGALLWSRRTQISDQVSKIVDRVSALRGATDVSDKSADRGEGDHTMVSSAGSRTDNGHRSQVEIAQEALALKQTGHT